jgi:hypothetical protein
MTQSGFEIIPMGRCKRGTYDDALGLRESETAVADTFEAEFPVVTGRPVEILSHGESPDRIALIGGIEIGIELTGIHASSADDIVDKLLRLASRKSESYQRRNLFEMQPIILLGHLDWPARNLEGPALYDVHDELDKICCPGDFDDFGFTEIWLIDSGPKYTSRRDPRAPADFFCFAPNGMIGSGRGSGNVFHIGA